MGEKISNSSKKSTLKKRSGFSKLVRSPIFIALGSIVFIAVSYFAYKTVHYYSAPAEIKLIRTLPIYNYESDNLKIVNRSEDYGGTDWKHVYNSPELIMTIRVNYRRETQALNEISSILQDGGWAPSVLSEFDVKDKARRYEKTVDGVRYYVSIRGSSNSELFVVIRT